jgi:hypothetical protein
VKGRKDFPNRLLYLWFVELSLWILVNFKLLFNEKCHRIWLSCFRAMSAVTLRFVPSHCLTTDINMGNRGSGLSSFCCWRATSITLLRLVTGHEKFRSHGFVLTKSAELWVLCKSEQLSSYFSYRCKYNNIWRVLRWIILNFESKPCHSKVRVLRRLVHQLLSCLLEL